jgi:SAM-dependent methyltransferase
MDEQEYILYQSHWHPDEISDPSKPGNPDTTYLFDTWDEIVRECAGVLPGGRLIDIGCGNGRDAAALSRKGWEAWGLDLSTRQLQEAAHLTQDAGLSVPLARGMSEFLPFADGTFDVVICKSVLDHFLERDRVLREWMRIVKPGGRLILSANNYEGITPHICRPIYSVMRRLHLIKGEVARHRFWDSPVPYEHTYEVTYTNLRELGSRYLGEPERSYGVSLFWGFPGWGRVLKRLPKGVSTFLLRLLDRPVRNHPRLADVIVFVWRAPIAQAAR